MRDNKSGVKPYFTVFTGLYRNMLDNGRADALSASYHISHHQNTKLNAVFTIYFIVIAAASYFAQSTLSWQAQTKDGTRSSFTRRWVLRAIVNGKSRDIGLRNLNTKSLTEARQQADEIRHEIATGNY